MEILNKHKVYPGKESKVRDVSAGSESVFIKIVVFCLSWIFFNFYIFN